MARFVGVLRVGQPHLEAPFVLERHLDLRGPRAGPRQRDRPRGGQTHSGEHTPVTFPGEILKFRPRR